MDPLYGTQLTDQLMANPWMLDPTQKSNQFSLYNNQRIPFPPTYNGAPTNAMGQPIQSFVDWQRQNPGGVSLNNTPAQPAQPANSGQWAINNAMLQSMGRNAYKVNQQGQPDMGAGSDVINMGAMNDALYGAQPGPGGSVPTPAEFRGAASGCCAARRRARRAAEQLAGGHQRPRQPRQPPDDGRDRADADRLAAGGRRQSGVPPGGRARG